MSTGEQVDVEEDEQNNRDSGRDSSDEAEQWLGSDADEAVSSRPVREVKAYKDESQIRDQQSTGRKRAAVMYPLDKEAPCDWKMMTRCGGGPSPITGCKDGKQQARHHGPDKNTLNNDMGNVHRICHNCHNRWHEMNDDVYVYELRHEYPKHSPVDATKDDIVESEIYWSMNKARRAKDY